MIFFTLYYITSCIWTFYFW